MIDVKNLCQIAYMDARNIHIGEEISKKVAEIGLSDAEFARRINTTRQNARSIYLRKSIDSLMLAQICDVLNHNFFSLYLFNNEKQKVNKDEPQVVHSNLSKRKVIVQLEVSEAESDEILKILNIK